MKIVEILSVPGLTGFYTDDKLAILKDAKEDGFLYEGKPLTKGFTAIRQPGESVLVMFRLDDGQIACGDCAGTQYSGAGGREAPFIAKTAIPVIEKSVVPLLKGKESTRFKELSEEIDRIEMDGKKIHPAIRYGVTQAVLNAVAKAKKVTMAEIVAEEYNTKVSNKINPTYAQTGDERYTNVDKMIIKKVDILPHGLINNVKRLVGENGEIFKDYVVWVRNRILKYGGEGYHPKMHFDVYGTIGMAFNEDLSRVADYLGVLEKEAKPFELIIEMPIDLGSKQKQMAGMKGLKEMLMKKGINVKLMVDEWCNDLQDLKEWVDTKSTDKINVKTIVLGGIHNIVESILYCNKNNIGSMMGGTCNETDISAIAMANIAMATQPEAIAARPGMGVDEGLMTIYNEMQRVLALKKR